MVKVSYRDKTWETKPGSTVRHIILQAGLNPESVLAVRNGKLINEETLTQDEEQPRHQPFARGECRTCHLPHSSDNSGLAVQPENGICFSCHKDLQKTSQFSHQPFAAGNCSNCHNPHASDQEHYLLQALPDLCLTCHDTDRYWSQGAAHAPAQQGKCFACHEAHISNHSGLLNRPASQLCSSCHDLTPQQLAVHHGGIAPGADSCLTCHDSHGGPDRSLTFPIKHEPFAEKDCAACHKEVAP